MKVPKFKETKRIKRCTSEPRLYFGESIFEELDIQLSAVLKKSKSLAAMHLLSTKKEEQRTRDLAKDLKVLAQRDEVQPDVAELLMDDLPPVIKSVAQDDKRKLAQAKLQRTIQSLEKLQRENRRSERDVKIIEPIFTQPDIRTIHFQKKDTVRISSVQVTERYLQVSPTLQMFKPQYNELLGEIPSSIVEEIDQVDDEKAQLEELYENINTILEKFENKESLELLAKDEDIFEAPDSLNFKYCINSSSLNLKSRTVNENLKVSQVPPWQGMKKGLWELVPQAPRKYQKTTIYPRHPTIMMQGEVTDVKKQGDWKSWWLSFFDDKDCLKYLSTMDSDFLHVIFHLYDDDEHLEIRKSIEDQEKMAEVLRVEKELAVAEAERKVDELRRKKTQYEDGFWNAETILLGGLGSDPSKLSP
ncbi:coiled-coil domain-containing protein 87 [Octopus bimaculoides]|uniref:Uncharacterized protein n=1 Tax=Octopus bimaculoides TaxID=37653 RepID=A0A0L8GEU9_OCTBM|nr:coiled-coil domain-containing protein 87 [Octopus bimaculoides]|eukprot:XP_014781936.1 PREDICTED: coiled-coil domain-containing protein 87-like [Octopus bimaculoides]